jgi:hypothetical protein
LINFYYNLVTFWTKINNVFIIEINKEKKLFLLDAFYFIQESKNNDLLGAGTIPYIVWNDRAKTQNTWCSAAD